MSFQQQFESRSMRSVPSESKDGVMSDKKKLDLNNLTYPMIQPVSLVVSRSQIQNAAQSTSYTQNKNMVFYLNTGSSLVNPRGCSLHMKVAWTTAGNYASASAVNLIQDVSITHSHSRPIQTIKKVNLHHQLESHQRKSLEQLTQSGSQYDYKTDTKAAPLGGRYVCIPLSEISGFFDRDILIPSQIMAGLKVEVTLSTEALATSIVGTFVISDPYISLDTFSLSDSANISIAKMAAKDGLVYPFQSYHTVDMEATSTSYSLSCFNQMSQATFARACFRTTADIAAGADSYAPISIVDATTFDGCSVQAKIGNLYYPMQALNNATELFEWNKSQNFNGMQHRKDAYATTSVYNTGVFNFNLERDHLLDGNGVSVSGSRAFVLNITASSSVARTLDLFVYYIRLVRAFSNSQILISE
jgi:hypothetical protein